VVRPVGGVITPGDTGRPEALLVTSAGLEVVGEEVVEAAAGKTEAVGGLIGVELALAEAGEDVTDERGGEPVRELRLFFIG